MIARRGFLGAILAAGIAPAFVRAGVLMPVKEIWVPPPIVAPSGQLGHAASKFYEMEIGRVDGLRFIESPVVTGMSLMMAYNESMYKIKNRRPKGDFVAVFHSDRFRA